MSKAIFSLLLVLHVYFLAPSLARPASLKAMVSGPIKPIENFSDPTVVKMGSYAISEYDKTTTYHLEFIRVVNGSTIFLSFFPRAQGIWFLRIEAKNCTHPENTTAIYGSQVYENFANPYPPLHFFPTETYFLSFVGLWKFGTQGWGI